MASTTSRRTVEDWVTAGLELLAEEGLAAVKIDRLCRRLGVTKGSFYWHFGDISAFLDALGDEWTRTRAAQRDVYASDTLTPRQRMETMMVLLLDPRETSLERAMREWARSDARVRARVEKWDRWILSELKAAFRDLGFTGDDIELRANTLFLAGVGYIHNGIEGRAGTAEQREGLLDLVTRR